MSGKVCLQHAQRKWDLHQVAAYLAAALVLISALVGQPCRCHCADTHDAATGCCELISPATICGCHDAAPTIIGADASTPGIPCSCCDANPLAYMEPAPSQRPTKVSAQYFYLARVKHEVQVSSRHQDGRIAVWFETPPKLCARLCRFLI